MSRRRWTDVALDVLTAIGLGLAMAAVFAFGPGGVLS
jgi:hypothetical protein